MSNKLDTGFAKADSSNLPKVSVYMVWEYIASNEKFNDPEVRGAKTSLSSRENYGDSAIGYVCVKRDGLICTLKAKVCPEHRVRQKDYTVQLVVDEKEEKVLTLDCFDCAAAEGGCKHGIAFLMWANRRNESLSVTEVECYWKKSKLSSVGNSKKFITTAEIIKNTYNTDVPEIFGENSLFLSQVIEYAKSNQLNSQLSRYAFQLEKNNVNCLSIHRLMLKFILDNNKSDCADAFIKYAVEITPKNLYEEAQKQTADQSENVLWHELRFGRITASNIYETSRCRTPEGTLVNKVIGAVKVFNTKHMERGRKLEKEVISEIGKQLNCEIKDSGLIIISSLPILGASPDGIGPDFVLEVKCPSSEATVKNYLSDGQISEKCKGQINLQMLAAGKTRGLFCVASPNFEENRQFNHIWVDYNEEYINNMIEKAAAFWKTNIFPILYKSILK